AHARANKLRVVPACSYVASFIERHREFADLLAQSKV
ncbi:MAG: N-acetyltransferase, partial [Opitutaceae bacterium]|nr:N-acetyltransferase [Opitutaceae bacterium]